jgi:hypothetical protein
LSMTLWNGATWFDTSNHKAADCSEKEEGILGGTIPCKTNAPPFRVTRKLTNF